MFPFRSTNLLFASCLCPLFFYFYISSFLLSSSYWKLVSIHFKFICYVFDNISLHVKSPLRNIVLLQVVWRHLHIGPFILPSFCYSYVLDLCTLKTPSDVVKLSFNCQTYFKELKRRTVVYCIYLDIYNFCYSFFVPDLPSFHLVSFPLGLKDFL